jgi:DNA adenine methylase
MEALPEQLASSWDQPEDMSVLVAVAREPLRPPLKWAGGKRWQLPYLAPLWRGHSDRRLVEPFCGGLAVALGLRPRRALLNDVNPHLVNFYRWVRRGWKPTLPMENESELFYAHREAFNALLAAGKGNNRRAAELFYYLNRTGYNGLCRFNASGEFNVPFGRYAKINYARELEVHRETFRGWDFSCVDIEKVKLERGDFIYADPPYDVPFTQYSRGGFSWDDQERTAELLARHKGPVVLSNQATDRVVKLYASLGFHTKILDAPRRISCTGDRKPAREVLATKGF